MSTPPPERVAVKTYVSAFSKERALSAIKFELQRGGQVFYVVPRIKGHNSVSFRCFFFMIDPHDARSMFLNNSVYFSLSLFCKHLTCLS